MGYKDKRKWFIIGVYMNQARDLDSVKNVSKKRKFIGSTFFRTVVVFAILIIGGATFVIKIVNAQATTSYPVTIAADPLAAGTAIPEAAQLDKNVNNYYSPNEQTTHTPPDPNNWSTAYWQVKDRLCPYGGANPVPNPPGPAGNNGDQGCGFGDALSTAAWRLRNNKTFCDNDRIDRIRVSWTVLDSDKSQMDTDGILGSLWDSSAGGFLRNVETIPGGGGILSYNATIGADAGQYIIRGSGESGVSSILQVDNGTLGFKIDPGNLYVNDFNNRFTIYQWRDQSAGQYTTNYELKEVTTTPPTVELIFDHPPRFPDASGSCNPIIVTPPKNYPFLQVQGDDVISGANFTTNGVCAAPSAASKNAKIYTNGFHGATTAESQDGSSNTQYGAWASGAIGSSAPGSNTFRANYGYVRNPSWTTEDIRDGLFANEKWSNLASEYGNFYDSAPNPSLPCFDVSADIARISSVGNSSGIAQSFLSTASSGTLLVGPTTAIDQFIQNITIPAGVHKTLIVVGDVTIRGDIKYPTAGYTSAQIPSLKIIAKNIYIESGAKIIDANLVALPEGSPPAGGIIDTCSNMVWMSNDTTSIGALPGQWPSNGKMTTSSCNTGNPGLVINGSIAARRILFKRTNGTLGPQSTAADPTCSFNIGIPATNPNALVQRYETCAAELIKFSPEAYISQLVNNPSATLQDVPVSTLELPPIN